MFARPLGQVAMLTKGLEVHNQIGGGVIQIFDLR